jgi:tRNA (guanine-N7-)-methyltransferase
MRSRHSWIVEPIGLEVRTLPKPITGRSLFGNEQPLEMEIGAGKGTFLAGESKNRPTVNFIGLERARRYWRLASDRLRRHQCLNVRLILADADYFLTEFIPQDCLTAVYVHFPDPWPKKRHHKRRLIQTPFLEEVERVLTPGGRFQVVTDHRDYYEQIGEAVASSSLIMSEYDRPATAVTGELVGSNFERKYQREGRVSYAVAAVKARTSSQLRRTSTG